MLGASPLPYSTNRRQPPPPPVLSLSSLASPHKYTRHIRTPQVQNTRHTQSRSAVSFLEVHAMFRSELVTSESKICRASEKNNATLRAKLLVMFHVMRHFYILWTTDTVIVHCFSNRRGGKPIDIHVYIVEHKKWSNTYLVMHHKGQVLQESINSLW